MLNEFKQYVIDEDWDYELLSENPNITFEIVQTYPGIIVRYLKIRI
jgi:hypothetical protein